MVSYFDHFHHFAKTSVALTVFTALNAISVGIFIINFIVIAVGTKFCRSSLQMFATPGEKLGRETTYVCNGKYINRCHVQEKEQRVRQDLNPGKLMVTY